MSEVSESIKQGLQEALEFAKGKETGARVHIPESIDVQRIRTKLNLSQDNFAELFGFSTRTVQEWEQGRRMPTGAAKTFLCVIDREPEAVRRALTP